MSNGVDGASEMSKVLKQIDERWGGVSRGSPDEKQSGQWESTCRTMNTSGTLKEQKRGPCGWNRVSKGNKRGIER